MKSGPKISHAIVWTLPFFSDLDEQQKAEVLKAATFKSVKRGDKLFRYGDALTHLYWLCAGSARTYRQTPDGHELTDSLHIAGDVLFDPDAQQKKRTHTMNAEVLQDSMLMMLPIEWIDQHIKNWDHLANKFLHLLAKRAQETRIEAEHQATFNAAQIVACFLQHLCVLHHFDPRGFTLPYTKSVIASRLGMELESFSRVLPKLRDLGIIVRGKEVSFTDIAGAQGFSCGSCSVAEDCPTHQAMQKLAKSTALKQVQSA